MKVKFYSLSSLPVANSNGAGSFVNVTSGSNAGMYYCDGSKFVRLDNVAQDTAGEVKSATVDASTGVVTFYNSASTSLFTLALADYIATEKGTLSGSAAIATSKNGVVTLKAGIVETSGIVSNTSASDITLAKVATTGRAEDITLDPSIGIGSYTSKANVQEAFGVVVSAFDGMVDDLTAVSSTVDTHISNADIHVTASDKSKWNAKQDAFSNATVLSGITAAQVSAWDSVAAGSYDTSGAAATALSSAKSYASGLVAALDSEKTATSNGVKVTVSQVDGKIDSVAVEAPDFANTYEAKGAAASVQGNTSETVESVAASVAAVAVSVASVTASVAALGSAAAEDVLVGTINDAGDSDGDDLVTVSQVKAFAAGVTGAMHFKGVVTGETAAAALGTLTDASNGDVALYGTQEYVYSSGSWVLFGDEGAYDANGAAATALSVAKTYASGLIDALDSEKTATSNGVTVTVSQLNGKIDSVAVSAPDFSSLYDEKGAAASALVSANAYADSLASNYDAAGAADTALSDAKDYTDNALTWLSSWPSA